MKSLKELTELVLSGRDNIDLTGLVTEIRDLYAYHTGLKPFLLNIEDIFLPSGKALSPLFAAHCVLDVKRTIVFLRGIHKAIAKLKNDNPGQKINIFYAGCGPYATLVTPFTTLFTSSEIGFYLLDINRESLDSIEKLYASLGTTGYIKDIICDDATTCRLPVNDAIHLVISETMQEGLTQEPQVAVMLNLIPQMSADALFIPEQIAVSAALQNKAEEVQDEYTKLVSHVSESIAVGAVYAIGRDNPLAHTPVTLQLPLAFGANTSFTLLTHITVFEDEQLHTCDCIITNPFAIEDVDGKEGKKVQLQYVMGAHPGFQATWQE